MVAKRNREGLQIGLEKGCKKAAKGNPGKDTLEPREGAILGMLNVKRSQQIHCHPLVFDTRPLVDQDKRSN